MNDWREIATDDIFDELEELSEQGRQELKIEPESIEEDIIEEEEIDEEEKFLCGRKKEVSFCCTTTIPSEFEINTGSGEVSWKNCLKCVKVFETVTASCEDGGTCEIPACVLKVVGCIPFIASARVKGDRDYNKIANTKSKSEISCSCCLCVDKCIRCFPLRRFGTPQCSRERNVKIGLKDDTVNVCFEPCEPCSTSNGEPECQTVTFSGVFEVWCARR